MDCQQCIIVTEALKPKTRQNRKRLGLPEIKQCNDCCQNKNDPAVILGNELAARKPDMETLKLHADVTISNSMESIAINRESFTDIIQWAELVLEVSNYPGCNGWVFIYHDKKRYFMNRDGRFATAKKPNPTKVSTRELREKYTQIKLDGRMTYMHREYAINMCVVNLIELPKEKHSICFKSYDFDTLCKEWISEATKCNIDSVYIDAIRNTCNTFSSIKQILIPTTTLYADHRIPNSQHLHTAVSLVTFSKNVKNAIERGERKDTFPCLLFNTETYSVVPLIDFENNQCYIFPSKRSLGEAICRTNGHNMHPNPANIVYTSFTKAIKKYETLGKIFPTELDPKEWNAPSLVKFTSDKMIVITPYMLWYIIKDNKQLQKLYNIYTEPIDDTTPKKKFGTIHNMSNIKRLLIQHPTDNTIAFMLESDIPILDARTKLIIVSTKDGTAQELSHTIDKFGYPYIQQSSKGVSKHKYLHRLVAETFLKPGIKSDVVNHIDGDRLNWHPSNLEWVSRSENGKHTHFKRDEEFTNKNAIRLESWTWSRT